MSLDASDYKFKLPDFEHPSLLFVLEDGLKNLIGVPLFYKPYIKSYGLKGNERVLDFGCGGGVGSRCLAGYLKRGGRLTCLDISHYWVEKAKKRLARYANVECRVGDIRELDIAVASFDVVSIFHVLHDIPPAERQATVQALSQVLKAGGRVFVREPTRKSHGMAVGEIRRLFAAAGLSETEYRETKSEYMGRYEKLG
ncbi:MAG TPA: class I SAM-dependent methyltransferase [Dehalococcoidia bacterium]|nr:class I SAM-dependent methyltransferase [Dehalococcoidia bacterium]